MGTPDPVAIGTLVAPDTTSTTTPPLGLEVPKQGTFGKRVGVAIN